MEYQERTFSSLADEDSCVVGLGDGRRVVAEKRLKKLKTIVGD